MELYIGGSGQGKQQYVRSTHSEVLFSVYDEKNIDELSACEEEKTVLIDHLHLWIREKLKQGDNPEKLISDIILKYSDCMIISDEVGNGLVPIEAFDREYRDRTGKILIDLAKKAERVERIICGLGQRLK